MLNRSSSVSFYNPIPIGTAISNGAGIYAEEILRTRDKLENEYGNVVSQMNISLAKLSSGALGLSDGKNIYLSEKYASNSNLTDAMKDTGGFHPPIGNKTGAEAVASHEIGHVLGMTAGEINNISQREIVANAAKSIGVKTNKMASQISEYARYNYHETIAEACADVYCNGSKASKASKAIMAEVKKLLK